MDNRPPSGNGEQPVVNEAEAALRYQQQIELLATSQLKRLSDAFDANIFVYSGGLDRENAPKFIECVEGVDPEKQRANAVLVICTFGGDIDAGYIIARHLKRRYQKFILLVFGHCKSAGTLLALGADELYVSHNAEFGPLDVQLRKDDEIGARNSGLDIRQSLASLQEAAYNMFTRYFFGLKFSTSGALTTKTAAEIASALTVGLLSPITAQLDPLRIGEFDRAVNVAIEYGHRLSGGDQARVERLVSKYSTHSFVIDYEEAKEIFANVYLLTGDELASWEFAFQIYLNKAGVGLSSLRLPPMEGAVITYIDLPENDPVEAGESIEEQTDETGNQSDAPTSGTITTNPDSEESTRGAQEEQSQTPPSAPVSSRSSKTRNEKPRSTV